MGAFKGINSTQISRSLLKSSCLFQDEMERFSLEFVDEPTAVTNNDRLDVYNNICLFKVREDNRRNSPTEMHIFQCIGRPVSESQFQTSRMSITTYISPLVDRNVFIQWDPGSDLQQFTDSNRSGPVFWCSMCPWTDLSTQPTTHQMLTSQQQLIVGVVNNFLGSMKCRNFFSNPL